MINAVTIFRKKDIEMDNIKFKIEVKKICSNINLFVDGGALRSYIPHCQ